MNDFYVYAWLRPCGTPFYIGKGRGNRDRAKKTGNSLFMRTLSKMASRGEDYRVVRLYENLAEADAHSLEILEISKWGRRCDGSGVLTNLTDGGEGVSGIVFSDESKKKMSAAKKGRPLRAEHIAKIAAANTNPSPDTRAKMSASRTGKKATPKMVLRLIEDNPTKDPKVRAKISDALRGMPKSASHKAKLSDYARNRPSATRAKLSAGNRLRPPVNEYKGVSWNSATQKWKVSIRIGKGRPFLGYFSDKEEAARVYDRAAIEAWGVGNCYLNFPDSITDGVAS